MSEHMYETCAYVNIALYSFLLEQRSCILWREELVSLYLYNYEEMLALYKGY